MASTSTRRDLRGEQAPSTPNSRLDSALGLAGPQRLLSLLPAAQQ